MPVGRRQELVDVPVEDPRHPPRVWHVEEFWPPAAEGRNDERHGWFPVPGVFADAASACRYADDRIEQAMAAGESAGVHPHDRYKIVGAVASTRVHIYGTRERTVSDRIGQTTIHERYGDAAVRAVVERSYQKFQEDPTLGPVFFGRDLGRIIRHQHMLFRIVTGAQGKLLTEAWLIFGVNPDFPDPRKRELLGARLREAHMHLGLRATHLVLVAGHIRDALMEIGAGAPNQAQLQDDAEALELAVLSMEPYVVAPR